MDLFLLLDMSASHDPDRATDVGGISLSTVQLFICYCRVNGECGSALGEELVAQ